LTYLLRDGPRELVLRRPPRGAKEIRAGHDMLREFRILTALHPIWPKVPRPIAFVPEERSPLGAPFYVMERVAGLILRGDPALQREDLRSIAEALVDTLAEIHAIDVAAAGLADLGRPDGYLTRQVDGWAARFERAATDDAPDLGPLVAWLRASTPASPAPTLVHNDFKLDNVVLDPEDPTRVRAVLDWEMSTVGDPLLDLGTSIAYWQDPGDPEELRALRLGGGGNLTRRDVVERYAARTGRAVTHMPFYYALALFKVAVIAQQIYARYRRGLTADERFARMGDAVRVLGRAGARAAQSSEV
jgi:aminoglycoside phosphotransferase (APT) family kinase protein